MKVAPHVRVDGWGIVFWLCRVSDWTCRAPALPQSRHAKWAMWCFRKGGAGRRRSCDRAKTRQPGHAPRTLHVLLILLQICQASTQFMKAERYVNSC